MSDVPETVISLGARPSLVTSFYHFHNPKKTRSEGMKTGEIGRQEVCPHLL
jgi:hypothetical protein